MILWVNLCNFLPVKQVKIASNIMDYRHEAKEQLPRERKPSRNKRAAGVGGKSGQLVAEATREFMDRLKEQAELLDLARDTIIVRDMESRIIFWNQGAEQTYGWSKQEALGQHSHSFLQTQFPESLRDIHHFLLREGNWSGELVHTTRDGRKILVDSRWALRRNLQGLPEVTLEINNDITERRLRDKQMLEQQEQLHSLAAKLSIAEERERRRIALQLHDGVGQYLAMCRLMLSKQILKDPQSAPLLEEVMSLLERATADTRALTLDLSPPVLYEMGLVPALEWLASNLRHPYELEVITDLDGDIPSLGEGLKVVVYRAASELLRNVAIHSGCRQATLTLRRQGHEMMLSVADQGRGFKAEELGTRTSQGLGLFNIREQLRALAGSIEIQSRPGSGTRVIVCLPLADDPRSD